MDGDGDVDTGLELYCGGVEEEDTRTQRLVSLYRETLCRVRIRN